jgi:hypothetical protein
MGWIIVVLPWDYNRKLLPWWLLSWWNSMGFYGGLCSSNVRTLGYYGDSKTIIVDINGKDIRRLTSATVDT